jgi:hypothetical protein
MVVRIGLKVAKPEISAKQHPGNGAAHPNGTNYAPVSPFSAQIWFRRWSQELAMSGFCNVQDFFDGI